MSDRLDTHPLRLLLVCSAISFVTFAAHAETYAQPNMNAQATKRVKKAKKVRTSRVAIASHRLQFAIPSSWSIQEKQGIYIIQSMDKALLAVLVTLSKPDEIPQAMRELDAFVPVQGATLGKPSSVVHGSIPIQILAGKGKMAASGRAVDLLSLTLNAVGKPVVGMVYVHSEVAPKHASDLDAWVKSIGILLTEEESKKLDQINKKVPKK